MKVVIDVEANSLVNPTKIWVIVCKDIDNKNLYIFRKVTDDEEEKERFLAFARGVELWVGHNFLGYDYPVLNSLLGLRVDDIWTRSRDTLVISKLFDYSRQGHSIQQYGTEFGIEKIDFSDWTKYSQQMEDYCVRDVEITMRLWNSLAGRAMSEAWRSSIELEQRFQLIVNDLHSNGFYFDNANASLLREKVEKELKVLDEEIKKAFVPKAKPIREIHPRRTKFGTLNRNDFRWYKSSDLSDFTGDPFVLIRWVPFNPASHKQLVEVLNAAGWKPTDKTQAHIDAEREYNRLRYSKTATEDGRKTLEDRIRLLRISGWKINETNLATLPRTAPSPARTLAKRILLESRRRTLVEWLGLVQADSRIHGKFYGIGAWTHRMAHQEPNTANIPSVDKLYGKEMRSLWRASGDNRRVLVGVDAEGIQLRIFAHYINDQEFTDAIIRGKKTDKTDPHSLNQRVLGSICKSRQDAKRFIYAYLLGAGLQKLSEVLGASPQETEQALGRLMERYTGLASLKARAIPKDAKRGFFVGLDGRLVPIPGQTPGERKHLVMSGYLQNGEAIIIKRTACLLKDMFICDIVHDEFVIETTEQEAKKAGKEACEAIRQVGQDLKLKCPLAGDYHIGPTWADIH